MRLGVLALAPLLMVACAEEPMGDPAILSFTVEPAEAPAGGIVTAHVEVENFVLTGDEGHEHDSHDHAEEGEGDHGTEGHVHVYFDSFDTNPVAMMTTHEAELEIPADAEVGGHVLMARLHGSDHLIIEPEVVEEIDFEVLP